MRNLQDAQASASALAPSTSRPQQGEAVKLNLSSWQLLWKAPGHKQTHNTRAHVHLRICAAGQTVFLRSWRIWQIAHDVWHWHWHLKSQNYFNLHCFCQCQAACTRSPKQDLARVFMIYLLEYLRSFTNFVKLLVDARQSGPLRFSLSFLR